MMKSSKRKSLGVAVLVACGVLIACGPEATTEELVSRAQKFIEQGDYPSATIELKNAISADANNAQARWLLGKTYFEAGDIEGAEKELGRARDLGMDPQAVLPLLAQALLLLGKHEDLIDLESTGLAGDGLATVLAAQGLSALGQGDVEGGSRRIDEALAASPESAHALVAKARVLLAQGQVAPAREQLDRALARTPDDAPAWSLVGDMEHQQQHLDLADQAYTKVLDGDPNSTSDRLKRAMVRMQANQTDRAQEDVEALKRRAPNHPATMFAVGLLHLQKNELDEAKSAMEQVSRGGNSYPLALFYLAAINAQQGNLQQAENYVTQFLAVAPDNASGRILASGLAMRAGNFARAEEFVRPVVAARDDDVAALSALSVALLAQGKTDEGMDLLTKVAQLQPDSAEAQTRLGAGLLATGEGSVGVEHLRKAIELDPKLQQADVLLVLNYMRQGKIEEGLRAAEDYRDRNPDQAMPYNVLGRVYLEINETDKARQAFSKALELAPGDPGASQSLAVMAVQGKDYDTARRYYDGVLKENPDYLPAHMQLAALDMAQGDKPGMVERLRQLTKKYPEAIEPRLVLARLSLGDKRPNETLALLNELDESYKKQPPVLRLMAGALLAQNDFAAAKAPLEQLVRLQPQIAAYHYQLALAHAGLRDNAAMQRELERAIELDPNYLPARVAYARSLLGQGENAKFEAEVGAIRKLNPDSPDLLLLEASLARLKGNDDEALAKLERAYAIAPSGLTVRTLAFEKRLRGDSNGGLKLLEDWVQAHPADLDIRLVLAGFYDALEQNERAVEQYAKVLEASPRNVVALNNLAWKLRKKDPEKAQAYAERAAEIMPASASVLDTLAMVLLERRQFSEAQSRIDEALTLAPGNPTTRYHAALIKHQSGNTPAAVVILEALVNEAKDFPEKQEAAELLGTIKK